MKGFESNMDEDIALLTPPDENEEIDAEKSLLSSLSSNRHFFPNDNSLRRACTQSARFQYDQQQNSLHSELSSRQPQKRYDLKTDPASAGVSFDEVSPTPSSPPYEGSTPAQEQPQVKIFKPSFSNQLRMLYRTSWASNFVQSQQNTTPRETPEGTIFLNQSKSNKEKNAVEKTPVIQKTTATAGATPAQRNGKSTDAIFKTALPHPRPLPVGFQRRNSANAFIGSRQVSSALVPRQRPDLPKDQSTARRPEAVVRKVRRTLSLPNVSTNALSAFNIFKSDTLIIRPCCIFPVPGNEILWKKITQRNAYKLRKVPINHSSAFRTSGWRMPLQISRTLPESSFSKNTHQDMKNRVQKFHSLPVINRSYKTQHETVGEKPKPQVEKKLGIGAGSKPSQTRRRAAEPVLRKKEGVPPKFSVKTARPNKFQRKDGDSGLNATVTRVVKKPSTLGLIGRRFCGPAASRNTGDRRSGVFQTSKLKDFQAHLRANLSNSLARSKNNGKVYARTSLRPKPHLVKTRQAATKGAGARTVKKSVKSSMFVQCQIKTSAFQANGSQMIEYSARDLTSANGKNVLTAWQVTQHGVSDDIVVWQDTLSRSSPHSWDKQLASQRMTNTTSGQDPIEARLNASPRQEKIKSPPVNAQARKSPPRRNSFNDNGGLRRLRYPSESEVSVSASEDCTLARTSKRSGLTRSPYQSRVAPGRNFTSAKNSRERLRPDFQKGIGKHTVPSSNQRIYVQNSPPSSKSSPTSCFRSATSVTVDLTPANAQAKISSPKTPPKSTGNARPRNPNNPLLKDRNDRGNITGSTNSQVINHFGIDAEVPVRQSSHKASRGMPGSLTYWREVGLLARPAINRSNPALPQATASRTRDVDTFLNDSAAARSPSLWRAADEARKGGLGSKEHQKSQHRMWTWAVLLLLLLGLMVVCHYVSYLATATTM